MYLSIYFGLELDDKVYPQGPATESGVHYHGPSALLWLLESHLGLMGYSENVNYFGFFHIRNG